MARTGKFAARLLGYMHMGAQVRPVALARPSTECAHLHSVILPRRQLIKDHQQNRVEANKTLFTAPNRDSSEANRV